MDPQSYRGRALAMLAGERGTVDPVTALWVFVGGLWVAGLLYGAVTRPVLRSKDSPPPNVAKLAGLPAPPTDKDPECVRNAYELQGLVYNPRGDPTSFEAGKAMWSVPGVTGVQTARNAQAIVRARVADAQQAWSRCGPARRDLGAAEEQQRPQPPIDYRDLYAGSYQLTWEQKNGAGCGPVPEIPYLPTTLRAAHPGPSLGGMTIEFAGALDHQAQFGGDQFITRRTGVGAVPGVETRIIGTFVERTESDSRTGRPVARIGIESGHYEWYDGETLLCDITYTGVKT